MQASIEKCSPARPRLPHRLFNQTSGESVLAGGNILAVGDSNRTSDYTGALMYVAAFLNELTKLAEETGSSSARRYGLPAAGVLGGAALAAAGLAAGRPALRAHFANDIKALLSGTSGHTLDRAKTLPPQALETARGVATYLKAHGLDPFKHRIGISATGGTGKSTLAKGLSKELGMGVLHLDDVGKSISGRDLTKHVRNHPIQPGLIAEQTHLLNQVDPNRFDAIIHLEKPYDVIEKQILKRGRGAGQLDVYDYKKLHKAIRTAFDATAGQAHEVAPGIRVKMRGPEGFQAEQLLGTELRNAGIDPSDMTRQQQVLSLSTGRRQTGTGLLPYVKVRNVGVGAGTLGLGGAGGYVASRYGTSRDG
jgi:hypothetical protein